MHWVCAASLFTKITVGNKRKNDDTEDNCLKRRKIQVSKVHLKKFYCNFQENNRRIKWQRENINKKQHLTVLCSSVVNKQLKSKFAVKMVFSVLFAFQDTVFKTALGTLEIKYASEHFGSFYP